jgi:hypothetical protein
VRKLLIRLYPRAWRERYGNELLALLEQLPVTPSTVVDVLGGAVGARWQQRGAWAAGVRRASRLRVLWWMASSLTLAATAAYFFAPELVTSPSLVRRLHAALVLLAALAAVSSRVAYGPQPGDHAPVTRLAGGLTATAWLTYLAAWDPSGPRGPAATPEWIYRALTGVAALGMAVSTVLDLRRGARRVGPD